MAAKHWSKDNAFVAVAIRPPGTVGVALANDEMRQQEVPFSFLAVRRGDDWLEGGSAQWDAVALAAAERPAVQFVLIGPQGQVHVTGGGDRHPETIADGAFSPPKLGLLRGARRIDGLVYVCGMKRQVYRRDDANRWTCISSQIAGGPGVFGFEAIDGFSASDLYTVGWEGEIWHHDGTTWTQCDSPAGEVLVDVCCAGDGVVYAIGRGNSFVKGRDSAWTVQQTGLPVELSNLAWFKGRLYAASTRDVFVLNDQGAFEPIAIPGDYPETCGALAADANLLVCAGARDLFTFDGSTWTRLD